ncbi:MAG: hypothetical protein EA388_14290 [Nitriliruptor sp.]|nr:MAG: hypothetical protein EA388_14290 [Nitriliruptor sp.]
MIVRGAPIRLVRSASASIERLTASSDRLVELWRPSPRRRSDVVDRVVTVIIDDHRSHHP